MDVHFHCLVLSHKYVQWGVHGTGGRVTWFCQWWDNNNKIYVHLTSLSKTEMQVQRTSTLYKNNQQQRIQIKTKELVFIKKNSLNSRNLLQKRNWSEADMFVVASLKKKCPAVIPPKPWKQCAREWTHPIYCS